MYTVVLSTLYTKILRSASHCTQPYISLLKLLYTAYYTTKYKRNHVKPSPHKHTPINQDVGTQSTRYMYISVYIPTIDTKYLKILLQNRSTYKRNFAYLYSKSKTPYAYHLKEMTGLSNPYSTCERKVLPGNRPASLPYLKRYTLIRKDVEERTNIHTLIWRRTYRESRGI